MHAVHRERGGEPEFPSPAPSGHPLPQGERGQGSRARVRKPFDADGRGFKAIPVLIRANPRQKTFPVGKSDKDSRARVRSYIMDA